METVPEPKKRDKKVILRGLAILVLGILVINLGYSTLNPSPKQTTTQTQLVCAGGKCNLQIPLKATLDLKVNVTDSRGPAYLNCQPNCSVNLPHDLILNNFYDWLIAFLNNAQSSAKITTSGMKNTAGSANNLDIWGTGTSDSNTWAAVSAGQGGLIEVGTLSTAAATRADTNIGSAFQSYFDTSSSCVAGSTDSVVISGSENANAGTTITESGLFYQSYAQGNNYVTMLAHDVFSGIMVSGGNTITVQYTWSLNNGGFNYNLCELLAGFWTQPNGAGNQVKTPAALSVFYDTVGRNVSWYPGCNGAIVTTIGSVYPLASSSPTTSACVTWTNGDTNNAMQIAIGTGSAAFTPTTRALTSPIGGGSNYITSTTYDSAGNAYETANIVLSPGQTVSEAAIYLTLPKGCIGYSPLHSAGAGSCITAYGSDTIMLLAATFIGQGVPNGQSIGITFEESG